MNKCQYVACKNDCKNKYCSLSCGAKQQQLNNPKQKKQNITVCDRDGCDETFNATNGQRNKRFCSRSCAAKVNNSRFPKRTRSVDYDPKRRCLFCSEQVKSGYSTFCSQSCAGKNRQQIKLNMWLSGVWVPIAEQSVPLIIRRFLIEESQNRCSSSTCCVPGGWSQVNPKTGRVPLTIDHIDGNARNNSRDNLAVLCPNCHSLTPTFGSLNKGRGRSYRMKRYRQGKTW